MCKLRIITPKGNFNYYWLLIIHLICRWDDVGLAYHNMTIRQIYSWGKSTLQDACSLSHVYDSLINMVKHCRNHRNIAACIQGNIFWFVLLIGESGYPTDSCKRYCILRKSLIDRILFSLVKIVMLCYDLTTCQLMRK